MEAANAKDRGGLPRDSVIFKKQEAEIAALRAENEILKSKAEIAMLMAENERLRSQMREGVVLDSTGQAVLRTDVSLGGGSCSLELQECLNQDSRPWEDSNITGTTVSSNPRFKAQGRQQFPPRGGPKFFPALICRATCLLARARACLLGVSVVFYFVARVVRTNPVGHFVLQAADVVSRSTAGRTGREAAVEEAGRTAVRRTVQRPGTTVQRWLGTPWKCRMRCLTVALLRAGARTKAMACVEPPGSIVVVVGGRLACRSARAVAAATVLQAVKLQAPN